MFKNNYLAEKVYTHLESWNGGCAQGAGLGSDLLLFILFVTNTFVTGPD